MSIALDAVGQATRARIRDEGFIDSLRAHVPAGIVIHTQAELDASLEGVLARHGEDSDIHVFGYGSLMWNPALDHVEASKAKVQGWHRRFCLRALFGRGCEQYPGLMLALDRGGACYGMLLRIEARKVRDELRLLWRREMFTGVYEARWVTAWSGHSRIRAITFTVNRSHPRYTNGLAVDQAAHLINTGRGVLGSCRQYFDSTLDRLKALGVRDAGMERLRIAIAG